MQLLTAAAAQTGAALVLVTHDRAVASWCGRIVEVRDGLVHAEHRRPDGSPDAPARSASKPLPSPSSAAPSPAAGPAVESAR